jgi:hypothetical protein
MLSLIIADRKSTCQLKDLSWFLLRFYVNVVSSYTAITHRSSLIWGRQTHHSWSFRVPDFFLRYLVLVSWKPHLSLPENSPCIRYQIDPPKLAGAGAPGTNVRPVSKEEALVDEFGSIPHSVVVVGSFVGMHPQLAHFHARGDVKLEVSQERKIVAR